MDVPRQWQGLPYFPISQFYRERFGDKVYKIPVSVAQTCPNREGLRGMKTCIFCDAWGSAAYPEFRDLELKKQIETARERIRARFNAHRFLVYFQAYTNTFSRVSELRRQFEVAVEVEGVKGFVVGTRPDCLSESVFDLWNEYLQKYFVAVELGVQTFDEQQLAWMERGHTAQKSLQAIARIRDKCPKIDLGIHLIFGLPEETLDSIRETARLVSRLPIDNVKLHNLHVLKGTELENQYLSGKYEPMDRDTYTERVMVFLQYLRPDIAVHRLAAVASRHDELVAPYWAASKLDNYQVIVDSLKVRKAFQGQFYEDTGIRSSEPFLTTPSGISNKEPLGMGAGSP